MRATSPSRPNRRGFTLIELIVVIVILGILAALAVPTFRGVMDRAADESTAAMLAAATRDAQALAGLENRVVSEDDLAAVASELAAAGISADTKHLWGPSIDELNDEDTTNICAVFEGGGLDGALLYSDLSPGLRLAAVSDANHLMAVTALSATGITSTGRICTDTDGGSGSAVTAPTTPAGLTAHGQVGQVLLDWVAVDGATSYTVTRDDVALAPVAGSTPTPANAGHLAWTDAGRTNGVPVTYTIKASNAAGQSAASAPVTATPFAAPATPTGLSATPGTATVSLAWTAVAPELPSTPVVGYRVYRGSALLGQVTAGTTYSDTTALNGVNYAYQVSAYNSAAESAPSNSSEAVTPLGAPGTPGGVNAVGGEASIVVGWTTVASIAGAPVTGYKIFRDNVVIATVAPGAITYTDASALVATEHGYQLSAYNSIAESSRSGLVFATRTAAVPGAPTAVLVSSGNSQLTVSWTPGPTGSSATTGYTATATAAGQIARTCTTATTSCVVATVTNGVTYTVTVVATNGAGTSAPSVSVTGTPVSPPSNAWASVSGSGSHNLAVTTPGELWAWGSDVDGQQGNGAATASVVMAPVRVGSATNWASASGGGSHSLAVTTTGELWAWGSDATGQVGNGATTGDVVSPVRIGSATNWAAVSAGLTHSLAVTTTGQLWAWGGADTGQVGNGASSGFLAAPVRVGTASNWRAVSAGHNHSLAITTTGELWAWGSDAYGQVGNGAVSATDATTPVHVGSATNWASVSAGQSHSTAVTTSGELWTWGGDASGQVGNGPPTGIVIAPVRVGVAANWASVSAGSLHTLATTTNGELWSWGSDASGRLGNGAPTAIVTAPARIGSATDWTLVSSGASHSVAITTTGALWAWGSDNAGQLGNGINPANQVDPVQLAAP